MMLELLHGTGLRISELVSLDVGDIDTGKGHVNVGSTRQVPLDAGLASRLAGFLRSDRLDLLYDDGEQALFLNRRGKRLTRQGLWQIIKEYASRAGLGDRVTPQTLRHSFARHRLQNGTDLRELQQLLGHAFISSTRIYRQPQQGRDNGKETTTHENYQAAVAGHQTVTGKSGSPGGNGVARATAAGPRYTRDPGPGGALWTRVA